MKVYLIRHGESIGNAKGIHQGQKNDFSLSELGRKQSNLLRQRFENIKIDTIYSSDLKRAKETAEFISKSKNIKLILDKRLRERDFGLIGEKENIMKEWGNFLKEQIENGINPREATPKDGESDKDHFDRINSFFEDLKKYHSEKDTVLVVAHGGTNKVAFGVIGHFSDKEMYKTPQGNTCINELIFENGNWNVKKINFIDHLDINQEIIKKFEKIRDEPLDVLKNRCWEKNMKLKEIFESKGYKTKYGICSFNWSDQKLPKEIINLYHSNLDYHLFLIVKINGLKLIVDASNDSLLPFYNSWDGKKDCNICVVPKERIEENIDKIIWEKLNERILENQFVFLSEVNLFFDRLREKKSILNKKV